MRNFLINVLDVAVRASNLHKGYRLQHEFEGEVNLFSVGMKSAVLFCNSITRPHTDKLAPRQACNPTNC